MAPKQQKEEDSNEKQISEGLGEMFQSDSADTCAGKFPLTSMGG